MGSADFGDFFVIGFLVHFARNSIIHHDAGILDDDGPNKHCAYLQK